MLGDDIDRALPGVGDVAQAILGLVIASSETND